MECSDHFPFSFRCFITCFDFGNFFDTSISFLYLLWLNDFLWFPKCSLNIFLNEPSEGFCLYPVMSKITWKIIRICCSNNPNSKRFLLCFNEKYKIATFNEDKHLQTQVSIN